MERARNGTRRYWIASLTLVTACHSYHPTATTPDGQLVRVRFAPEQNISVTLPKGDEFRAIDVLVIEGEVTRVRGDSVDLTVHGLRDKGGYLPSREYRGGRATIVRGPQSTLELRRFSGPRTALMAMGVAFAAFSVAAIAFAIGMSSME